MGNTGSGRAHQGDGKTPVTYASGNRSLRNSGSTSNSRDQGEKKAHEQREKIQAAAQARQTAWNEKLKMKREIRNQNAAEKKANQVDYEKRQPLSVPDKLPEGPDLAKLNREQKEAIDRLRDSGFDPYKMAINTHREASLALNSSKLQDSRTGNVNNRSPGASSGDSYATNIAHCKEECISSKMILEAAINSGSLDELVSAILHAKDLIKLSSEDCSEIVLLRKSLLKAINLRDFMKESKETATNQSVQGLPEKALASLEFYINACINDCEQGLKSVQTLLKILDNISQSPDNEAFRQLRLSNPKIKDRLVIFADGIPLALLKELGFILDNSESDNEAVVKLSDSEWAHFANICPLIRDKLTSYMEVLAGQS